MRSINLVLAVLTAAIVAACGGGSSDQTQKTKFSAQVSFGDSLSDVGTYAVGPNKAMGGGKFTINGDNTAINPALTGKNWTELMAARFGLPAPCAAQTGLDGSGDYIVAIENHPGCLGYAQGGARISNAVGPNNKLTGATRGDLTVPVSTQIKNHLAASGSKFKGDEIVFVMVGGNEAFVQLATLSAGAAEAGRAAGALGGAAAGAQAAADYAAENGPKAVAAMAAAGAELALLVKTQILANGANFVTVNNLPDLATTPSALAQSAATQALIVAMVNAFNGQLKTDLGAESKVLIVDVYAVSHDQAVNPVPYGLTNVTDTACDLSPAKNALASSLVCNAGNLKPGDVSHYAFADDVHPTPFGNLLLARHVAEKLVARGWL